MPGGLSGIGLADHAAATVQEYVVALSTVFIRVADDPAAIAGVG